MKKTVTVEKRVAIFSADALAALGRLGVRILDGSGRIHATLEIPEGAKREAMRVIHGEGFEAEGEQEIRMRSRSRRIAERLDAGESKE
ncbi:MAG: hypothetical protein BWZ10_03418 [candidate division BRC1 bacterium ADurb.BinA364]|nr:MAG: hypothetical protein BWZ10_03418 [candidate division BRC1 bacterium ADurb.BinA364]